MTGPMPMSSPLQTHVLGTSRRGSTGRECCLAGWQEPGFSGGLDAAACRSESHDASCPSLLGMRAAHEGWAPPLLASLLSKRREV